MAYKIGLIGSEDVVKGFRALGVEVFSASDTQDAKDALAEILNRDDLGVLFITEDLAADLGESLQVFKNRTLPAICVIPSHTGSTGEGIKNLKKIVEQAVGSDILKD